MESADEKDRQVRVWDALSSELLSAYNNEVVQILLFYIDVFSSNKIQLMFFILKSQ